MTLLVVPAYHRLPVTDGAQYERVLEYQLSRGDELALHGYTHLDDGPAAVGFYDRFARNVFASGEAEFSAIAADDARRRIEMGIAWFAQRGWPVTGFVAPAWLLGPAAWHALLEFPFQYTTTLYGLYLLPRREAVVSPPLVYSARNAWGRPLSRSGASMLAHMLQRAPLVRLGLHPKDADFPETVAHCQALLEKLLATRQAMTKARFAQMRRAASTPA